MKKHVSFLFAALMLWATSALVAQETPETPEVEITEENSQSNIIVLKDGDGVVKWEAISTPNTNVNGNARATALAYQALNNTFCGGSFLGIHGEEVDEEKVEKLSLPGEYGAHVVKVVEGSAAEKAGIQEDDVIVGYNDSRVESMAQLRRLLSETPVGRTVSLTIVRNGAEQRVSGELTARPGMSFPSFNSFEIDSDMNFSCDSTFQYYFQDAEELEESLPENIREKLEKLELNLNKLDQNLEEMDIKIWTAPNPPDMLWLGQGAEDVQATAKLYTRMLLNDGVRLGVTVQSLSPQLGRYFKLDEGQKGVLVSEVHEGFPAKNADIRAGDVIVTIDGEEIVNPFDIRKQIVDKEGTIAVQVIRDGVSETIYVDLSKREDDSSMNEELFMMPESDANPFLNSK